MKTTYQKPLILSTIIEAPVIMSTSLGNDENPNSITPGEAPGLPEGATPQARRRSVWDDDEEE